MVRDNDDICLLRFFVGKLIYFMVVYLNVVFSLVVDFNGLYLLFGSKLIYDLVIGLLEIKFWKYFCFIKIFFFFLGYDCLIRFWNLDSKTCV